MKKKLLVVVVIVVACIGLLFGYISWSSRNTAKAEAKTVLEGFASATSSQWYCENGSGKGIDNSTPWWEEIYVSNASSEETANRIEEYLRGKEYSVSSEYIENSQDQYNKGKTYWEIHGKRDNHSVLTRVSANELTLNNCFKDFSNRAESLVPEKYPSVIVIQFRDGS